MTSNDYAARLDRLEAAVGGDTVTVPDGWTLPAYVSPDGGREEFAKYRPGVVLEHDGGRDDCPWQDPAGRFQYTRDLALIGLDVDPVGVPAGETEADGEPVPACSCGVCSPPAAGKGDPARVTVSAAAPETTGAVAGGFGYHAWVDQAGNVRGPLVDDEDDATGAVAGDFTESFGTVSADGVALDEVDEDTAGDAAGFHLDEFQSERVAALEQAVRVLESRRAPQTSGTNTFGDMFARSGVPMVGVRDLIDVAAFIAIGETGRLEVSA